MLLRVTLHFSKSVLSCPMNMSSDADLFSDEDEVEDNEEWKEIWREDTIGKLTSTAATDCDPDKRKRQYSLGGIEKSPAGKQAKNSAGSKEKTNELEHENDAGKVPAKASPSKDSDGSLVSRMLLNDNKAGMEGLDKEKINSIIYQASKGSRFYENELKKEEQVNRRIEEQQERLDRLTAQQIQQGNTEADKLLEELESGRNLSRTIVHVDMDMFYAAVEMRDSPALRNKPMAVGGSNMLSTSNYIARRYGVRAAMPGFIGKKLCPDLVIVKSNHDKYQAVSEEVRDIFKDYDPNFAPMSLDEAYLDFTELLIKRQKQSLEERTYAKRGPATYCQCLAKMSLCLHDYNQGLLANKTDNVPEKETAPVKCNEADDKTLNQQAKLEHARTVTEEHAIRSDNNDNIKDAVVLSIDRLDSVDGSSTDHQDEMCTQCQKAKSEDIEWQEFGLSAEEAVREMRFRIEHRTELTASAGIAPNTMLAKVCSDKNKPNGQYRISPTREAVMEFVQDLPIRKVSGVGKVSEKMLSALDIMACPDILEKRGIIYCLYSEISFHHYMRIAIGIGSTHVERDSDRKSMSVERTFREINKPAELYEKCRQLCESLSEDLKEESLVGKTVTLKLKTVKFEVKTRAKSLKFNTNETEQIFSMAKEILRTEIQTSSPEPLRLRLMGVRMSNFLNQNEKDEKQKTVVDLFKIITKRDENNTKNNIHPTSSDCVVNKPDTTDVMIPNESDNKSPKKRKSQLPASTGTLLQFMKPSCSNMESTGENSLSVGYDCPVCGCRLQCASLVALNKHIDQCLTESNRLNPDERVTVMARQESCEAIHYGCNEIGDESTVQRTSKILSEHCDTKSICDNIGNQKVKNGSEVQSTLTVLKNEDKADSDMNDHFSFVCPVCDRQQSSGDLNSFNFHVDACLNKHTIQEMLQRPSCASSEPVKRSLTNQCNPSKKRKHGGNSNNEKSIQNFFKRERKT